MRRLLLAAICSAAVIGSAQAQSTAQPVVPGYISTVGCPGTQKSCFLPFSPSNPLPVSGGGGGGGTVTQGTAASASGAWPVYLTQGGAANSATNPIFTQITAGSSAPGTSAGTAFTVQGSTSGVPLPISGTVTPTTGATMTTSQPTVTTSAGQLTFAGSAHRELVNPPGNSTIYIGGSSGVTTTTGYPIFQGTSYDVTRFTGSVYAIGTASQTIGLISY